MGLPSTKLLKQQRLAIVHMILWPLAQAALGDSLLHPHIHTHLILINIGVIEGLARHETTGCRLDRTSPENVTM